MSRVIPPRRLDSTHRAPPGSLIRVLERDLLVVRLPDGSGWSATGIIEGLGPVRRGDDHGWAWDRVDPGPCEVIEEALTHDECLAILTTPYQRLIAEAKARPWLVGVGVIVTHVSDAGEARVLYCPRLAGASDGVGAYSVPGGRLEATDADVVACARRETLEEAGLVLADARVLPGHKLGRRPDGTPYLSVFVHATIERGGGTSYAGGWPVAATSEPSKHGPWSWFSATELRELHDVSVEVGLPGVWDLDLALEVLASLAPAKKRYVAVSFVDDDADEWLVFETLAEAHAACEGVSMTDVDTVCAYVWDLHRDELLLDTSDSGDGPDSEWFAPKIVSPKDALADLRASWHGKVAPL